MKDLFITLLNMSISATWLIFAVVLVRLCLGKAPKWIRGVLWAMVALRLVVPLAIESPVSLVPHVQISAKTEQLPPTAEAPFDLEKEQAESDSPVVDTPVFLPNEPSVSEPVNGGPVVDGPAIDEPVEDDPAEEKPVIDKPVEDDPIADRPVADVSAADEPNLTPDEVPVIESDEPEGVDIALIFALLWVIGAMALAVYCLGSYWRLKLKLREAVLVEDGVYESDRTKSAFVLGIIKPRIYLPRTLPAGDREYVIAHERVHIGRFDHILKPLGFLILALHWYNPAVWLAYILFCRDTELACDEKVIKGYNVEQVKGYSRALVACGEGHCRILVCPIAFGEVGIKERVKNILNYKKPAFWIVVGAVALCVIVAVCFMTVRSDNETGASDDSTEETESVAGSGSSDEVTEPTEEPTGNQEGTDPTEEPTDNQEGTDPTEEPTENTTDEPYVSTHRDISIIGTRSRPAGAEDVDFEKVTLFTSYSYYAIEFDNLTVPVANSVDSEQKHYVKIITDYREFCTVAEKAKENRVGEWDVSRYDEEFFEEHLIILNLAGHPKKASVSGGELCLEYDHQKSIKAYGVVSTADVPPTVYRAIIVSYENIGEIDTVSICSRHYYHDLPEQVPALPKAYRLTCDLTRSEGEKGDYSVSEGYYFRYWGFTSAGVADSIKIERGQRSRRVSAAVFEEYFWFKAYMDSGAYSDSLYEEMPEPLKKYDPEFFSDKILIMLEVPGKPYENEVTFDGKKDGILHFTTKIFEECFYNSVGYYNSWYLIEIEKSLFDGVNLLSVNLEINDDFDSQDEPVDCDYGIHDMVYLSDKCYSKSVCSKCHYVEYSRTYHQWDEATCTEASTCSKCGATKGEPLGHIAINNYCKRDGCDEVLVIYPNVLYPTSQSDNYNSTYYLDGMDITITLGKKCTLSGTGDKEYATIKIERDNDYVYWERSTVQGYVDGILTDLGEAKLSDDGKSIIIPYTGDGEYLLKLFYGNADTPYVPTISIIVKES